MKKLYIISIFATLLVVGFAISQSSALMSSNFVSREDRQGYGSDNAPPLPAFGPGSSSESHAQSTAFQVDCVATPAGMINWYPGDGNANDIQGGRNGTLRNGASFAAGKVLQAFRLDGSNDYVDVGDLDLPATFTIDAWIRPSGFPSGFPHILDKDSVTDERSYYFSLDNRRLELLVVRSNPFGATRYRTTATVVTGDAWQLVAATYDGSAPAGQKVKFYHNGINIPAEVVFGQDAGGTPDNNSFPARIGSDSADNGFAFNGLIDELETFNRVLSAAEVQQLFAADTAGKCKPGGSTPTPTPTPTPSPTPEDCEFTFNQISQTVPVDGGIGNVIVTQTSIGPPCSWDAVAVPAPNPFFFLDTLLSSGTGSGVFSYTVGPNSSGFGRAGAINFFAGPDRSFNRTFFISQPTGGGNCTYMLSPSVRTISRGQNNEDIAIEVKAPPNCPWTASESVGWITLGSFSSGNGNGFFSYDANENFTEEFRSGIITVAGQIHVVNQMPSTACPIDLIDQLPRPSEISPPYRLDQFRGFRDEVLGKTERGKKYTHHYYEYAGEITKLLIFNPSLFFRSRDVVSRYQPVVESVLRRERAKAERERTGETAVPYDLEPTVVFDTEIDDVTELLAAFSEKASGSLGETLDELISDIRNPEVQAEFGVRLERGAKRPLPGEERSSTASFGDLWLFDLPSRVELLNPFSSRATIAKIPDDGPALRSDAKIDAYGQIPLSFEANQGQVDASVKYLSRGAGYNLFLTGSEAVLSLPVKADGEKRNDEFEAPDLIARLSDPETRPTSPSVSTLRMKLEGANQDPRVTGQDELPGKSNYFIGQARSKWQTDIPTYSRVEYEEIYRGIDLVYYGNQRQLEYDFKVAPGADPANIKMNFDGAEKMDIDPAGDLILQTAAGDLRMLKPVTYQQIAGVITEIPSRYILTSRSDLKSEISRLPASATLADLWGENLRSEISDSYTVGFEVGDYDRNIPLVIDPVIMYSTYLGGSGEDLANSITTDAAGNAYIIGFTDSANFPVAGAMQPTYGGNPQDIFVSKINAAGNALVYSTYLGGSGQDNGSDIAVDAAGNAYITGYTGSVNFPVASALQPTRTGLYNAFVAKLNPAGSQLVYSTYYGGTTGEYGSSIAVDASGNAYVGGVTSSANFPDTAGAVQTTFGGSLADAFVTKFNAAGNQVLYSTMLGGNGNDGVTGIAVDPTGNAYVTGVTFSTNFPTASPLQQNYSGGAFDSFVTKLNPNGTSMVYSTYLGGTDEDRGFRIALDAAGYVYVAGMTQSTNFPTAAAFQPTIGGGSDAFVTKLTPAGAISYSTFLGGSGNDGATGLAIDPGGSAFLTGFTASPNFPLAAASQPAYGGGEFDAFVTKFNAAGTALNYSTYMGGALYDTGFDIAVDSLGKSYVVGRTASANFPLVNPLQGSNSGGGFDVFISKFDTNVSISGKVTTPTGLGLRNAVVTLTDPQGVRQTATTSSFGVYNFGGVRSGETYLLSVSSKRYRFASRSLSVNDSLTGIDFVGLE